jgi:hypothetical protein
VHANITNSEKSEHRLKHTSSLFMQSINVASIAVLTSLGVTFLIDKLKDKKDNDLREEIKTSVSKDVNENRERIIKLEGK